MSIEAEGSVLGAIIINNDILDQISDTLRATFFSQESHRTIYSTMLDMHNNAKPIDVITLPDALKKKRMLESVGGKVYVLELTEGALTANVDSHVHLIKTEYVKRGISEVSQWAQREIQQPDADADEVLDGTEKKIFSLKDTMTGGGYESIADLSYRVFKDIEAMGKHGKNLGFPTGYTDLGQYITGLKPSHLTLIASRPSIGKTTLATNLCENMCINGDLKCAFFSLEMSREEVIQRMIFSMAGIPSRKAYEKKLTDDDWTELTNAHVKIGMSDFTIDDSPTLTISDIRARARRLNRQGGLDMVMVDYLQLITAPKRNNREQEVALISKGLKALAKELKVPVVAMSQLRRLAQEDSTPKLSDLRESGSLEQDADEVIFIHRKKDEHGVPVKEAKIIIAKQRSGQTGAVDMMFNAELCRFEPAIDIGE